MLYLDQAATSKVKEPVKDLIIDMLQNDNYANPSSVYEIGRDNKRLIEDARQIIANKINADPDEIIFTSSASAANTLTICGYLKANQCYNYIISNIEHSSLLNIEVPFKYKHIINCNENGLFTPEQFESYKNCVLSIGAANNEIGTIQPITEIAKVLHRNNNIVHSDLTQYIPYHNVNVKDMGLDMASFSGHKIGALKGIGVLYKRKDVKLSPLVFGSQEQGLFAGTENIYGIASIGKAMEVLSYENIGELKHKRDYLLGKLLEIPGIIVNGDMNHRLPNNINICIKNMNINNQELIAVLGMYGYYVSAGSACHSGDPKPSYVLKAIGLSDEDILKSIRITLPDEITYDDLDMFFNDLKCILEQF